LATDGVGGRRGKEEEEEEEEEEEARACLRLIDFSFGQLNHRVLSSPTKKASS
jgi:hypothetical protein